MIYTQSVYIYTHIQARVCVCVSNVDYRSVKLVIYMKGSANLTRS